MPIQYGWETENRLFGHQTGSTNMKYALALAAALLSVGATAAKAQEPDKIGYAISKTGPFAAAAHTQVETYEMWADQVAAAGGIDVAGTKRPVKFVVYDDQSDFSKAP